MTTCPRMPSSSARISTSRTLTSPTTVLTDVWPLTLWENPMTITSSTCMVSSPSFKQSSTLLSLLTRAEYEINKFDLNNVSFSLGYHIRIRTLFYLKTFLIPFTALSLWRNDSRLVLDCNNRPLFKRICVVQRVFKWWAIVAFTMHSCASKKRKETLIRNHLHLLIIDCVHVFF